MDSNNIRFGSGPRELGGAVDLVSHFGLWPYHDFFCKNSLPLLISDTHYLSKVVGDTEIRKDDEKKVNQLFEQMNSKKKNTPKMHPLGLAILGESFHVQRHDMPSPRKPPPPPPPADKEIVSSVVVNLKSEVKEEKQQRKRRDRAEEKHKEPKKHKSGSIDKDSKVKVGSHRKVASTHLKAS